jgi:hypothetical protein
VTISSAASKAATDFASDPASLQTALKAIGKQSMGSKRIMGSKRSLSEKLSLENLLRVVIFIFNLRWSPKPA